MLPKPPCHMCICKGGPFRPYECRAARAAGAALNHRTGSAAFLEILAR
jgi:hypothetical protein